MSFLKRLFSSSSPVASAAMKEVIIKETASNEVRHQNCSFFTSLVQKCSRKFHFYAILTIVFTQIVIFSKTYCPYCSRAKSLFASQFPSNQTKVLELDQMQNGSEIQSTLASMTGQRTVPSVWVKGTFIGGNDDTQKLYQSGKLNEMLT